MAKIAFTTVNAAIQPLPEQENYVTGWQNCKVAYGRRTDCQDNSMAG
jgi:hypothetical protein